MNICYKLYQVIYKKKKIKIENFLIYIGRSTIKQLNLTEKVEEKLSDLNTLWKQTFINYSYTPSTSSKETLYLQKLSEILA